ncbi:MAG: hypothetical protein AAB857_01245 [Patescibacteria group bacterium]
MVPEEPLTEFERVAFKGVFPDVGETEKLVERGFLTISVKSVVPLDGVPKTRIV